MNGPTAQSITPEKAQITWETDIPGNSIIDFGLNSNLDSSYIDYEEVRTHNMILNGLVPDTLYYYQVHSITSDGTQISSAVDTFSTLNYTLNITSGPAIELLSPTEVQITWETDTLGSSIVSYGLTTDLDSSYVDDFERKSHIVTLSALIPDTFYYYQIYSLSSAINRQSVSEIDTFSTGEYKIAVISGPLVQFPDPNRARITWQTDIPGNSIVDYGTSPALELGILDEMELVFHSVILDSLTLNTTYYYRVASRSSIYNVLVSTEMGNFTTGEGEINIVEGPSVDLISPTEVFINWETDVPGNSIVDFGLSDLDLQILDSEERSNHIMYLANLFPDTKYYYRITSVSSAMDAQVTSVIDTFITGKGEIIITGPPTVGHLSPTEVLITWETDIPGNSIVEIGTTAVLDSQVISNEEQSIHSVYLSDLLPGTTYYYRVISISSIVDAQVSSETDTFSTTKGEITIITGPAVESVSPTEVLIVWETDVPGNSIVDYSLTTLLDSQFVENEEQVVHGASLVNLLSDTTYYYRVKSISTFFNAEVSSVIDTFFTNNPRGK